MHCTWSYKKKLHLESAPPGPAAAGWHPRLPERAQAAAAPLTALPQAYSGLPARTCSTTLRLPQISSAQGTQMHALKGVVMMLI